MTYIYIYAAMMYGMSARWPRAAVAMAAGPAGGYTVIASYLYSENSDETNLASVTYDLLR